MPPVSRPQAPAGEAAAAPAAARAAATPLGVGLVGLGLAGSAMVRALADHPDCVLAGAAEPSALLRERFGRDHACPVHDDIAGLVGEREVDIVYIATPHHLHAHHAILAARHGKHVIVEKPMALTLEDCDAMIAAAQEHAVALVVGHTHGFDPTVAAMRALVASGQLGRPALLAMMNYTNFLYRPRRPEELDTARGGGILYNQLPHQIDMARTILDAPVASVRAHAAVLDPARPTEGACAVLATFANGAAASLLYSGYDGFDSDELCDWIGESGRPKSPAHGAARRALAALGGAEGERRERVSAYGYGGTRRCAAAGPVHQPHFGLTVLTCARGDIRPTRDGLLVYAHEGTREIRLPPADGTAGRREVLDEICGAVRSGRMPLHDGRFGRDTLAVCLAIGRSAREGREVALARQEVAA